MKKGEVWAIEWIDSESSGCGWKSLHDKESVKFKASRIMSVGHVIEMDRDRVILTGDIDPTYDSFHNSFSIPLACIKKKKKINIVKDGKWIDAVKKV